eukprot:1621888-Prymnesium_polylepis.1
MRADRSRSHQPWRSARCVRSLSRCMKKAMHRDAILIVRHNRNHRCDERWCGPLRHRQGGCAWGVQAGLPNADRREPSRLSAVVL